MKLLIFSDSHGEITPMEKAVFAETPDTILHLGDCVADAQELHSRFPRIPMICVAGNCDFRPTEEKIRVEMLGGVRFYLTHGHTHGVKTDLTRLRYAAMEAQADVALFGHTHYGVNVELEELRLFNPGCCSGGMPTYGVIEIAPDKTLVFRHTTLNE